MPENIPAVPQKYRDKYLSCLFFSLKSEQIVALLNGKIKIIRQKKQYT